MKGKYLQSGFVPAIILLLLSAACSVSSSTPESGERELVVVVIDSGSKNDRSFNEYTLRGVEKAAEQADMEFSAREPQSINDYESAVETSAQEGADLIVTVGFRMGDATAKAARRHPQIHFIIVDNAFLPGAGCAQDVQDCYSEEGGLTNVTSLLFAEDQVGYLAGVLAACMTKSGIVASVAGMDLPPVVRFVTGFQTGARSYDPKVDALNQYIPDFNDPEMGKVVAQSFINQGADVIFGVGGNTGNGALDAAHQLGLMAIGVDVDQYLTYPEVRSALISSASKKVDRAAESAVLAYAQGSLEAGIRLATLENGGVDLAPFHDWQSRVPDSCQQAINQAKQALIANPNLTGIPKP